VFFKEMADAMRHASLEGTNKEGIEILAPGMFGYRSSGSGIEGLHQTPHKFLKVMDGQIGKNAYDAFSIHPYVFKVGQHQPLHGPENKLQDIREVTKDVRQVIN